MYSVRYLPLVAVLFLVVGCPATYTPQQGRIDTHDAAETFFHSVVTVTQNNNYGRSLCSGVVVAGGRVLTAAHCVDGGVVADVGFYFHYDTLAGPQREYTYLVAEVDHVQDTAVLEFAGPEILPDHLELSLANRDPLLLEPVFAIGHPRGLYYTLTSGAITAPRREGPDEFPGMLWTQASAPIAPGNSGGPLLSAQGEILGICSFGWEPHLGGWAHVSKVREILNSVEKK